MPGSLLFLKLSEANFNFFRVKSQNKPPVTWPAGFAGHHLKGFLNQSGVKKYLTNSENKSKYG
jgi:hypothetical protein